MSASADAVGGRARSNAAKLHLLTRGAACAARAYATPRPALTDCVKVEPSISMVGTSHIGLRAL